MFNRAPAEWQVQAYGILFESADERCVVDAEADSHAVGDEMTLESRHAIRAAVTVPCGFVRGRFE
jgi:hypothetical protein